MVVEEKRNTPEEGEENRVEFSVLSMLPMWGWMLKRKRKCWCSCCCWWWYWYFWCWWMPLLLLLHSRTFKCIQCLCCLKRIWNVCLPDCVCVSFGAIFWLFVFCWCWCAIVMLSSHLSHAFDDLAKMQAPVVFAHRKSAVCLVSYFCFCCIFCWCLLLLFAIFSILELAYFPAAVTQLHSYRSELIDDDIAVDWSWSAN